MAEGRLEQGTAGVTKRPRQVYKLPSFFMGGGDINTLSSYNTPHPHPPYSYTQSPPPTLSSTHARVISLVYI